MLFSKKILRQCFVRVGLWVCILVLLFNSCKQSGNTEADSENSDSACAHGIANAKAEIKMKMLEVHFKDLAPELIPYACEIIQDEFSFRASITTDNPKHQPPVLTCGSGVIHLSKKERECSKNYFDSYIQNNFRKDFYSYIEKKADSLYKTSLPDVDEYDITTVDQQPEYPGGQEAMFKFLKQ